MGRTGYTLRWLEGALPFSNTYDRQPVISHGAVNRAPSIRV